VSQPSEGAARRKNDQRGKSIKPAGKPAGQTRRDEAWTKRRWRRRGGEEGVLRVDEGWMDLDSAKARTEGGGNGKDEGKRAKRAPGGLGLSRGELRRGPPG